MPGTVLGTPGQEGGKEGKVEIIYEEEYGLGSFKTLCPNGKIRSSR